MSKLVKRTRRRKLLQREENAPIIPSTYEVSKALYNTPMYKAWREAVFIRDEYTCQMCGRKGALEAHHIRTKKLFPELTLDETNGITLCKHCHQKLVTGKEDRFAYIFSRVVRLNIQRQKLKEERP